MPSHATTHLISLKHHFCYEGALANDSEAEHAKVNVSTSRTACKRKMDVEVNGKDGSRPASQLKRRWRLKGLISVITVKYYFLYLTENELISH